METGVGVGLLVLIYSVTAILVRRRSERHLPFSVVFANIVFLFFYCFGYAYHGFRSTGTGYFVISRATFWYSNDRIIDGLVALVLFIFAFEFMNISVRVFVPRFRRPFQMRNEQIVVSRFAFPLLALTATALITLFLFRIVSTVGIGAFFRESVLRAIVFEGMGIAIELMFVTVFAVTYMFAISRFRSYSTWASLFCLVTVFSFARWPFVLLAMAVVTQRVYLRGRDVLSFRHFVAALSLLILAISMVLWTRPINDAWNGPLDFIFATEQAPQAANLIVADDTPSLRASLERNPFEFVGEIVPRAIKSRLGVPESLGGNHAYTEANWPDRLENTGSEISLGGLNELYLRGGWSMVLGFFFFAVVFYNLIYKFCRERLTIVAVELALCWFWFQLLRSDLAHTFSRIPGLILAVIAISYLVSIARKQQMPRKVRIGSVPDGIE